MLDDINSKMLVEGARIQRKIRSVQVTLREVLEPVSGAGGNWSIPVTRQCLLASARLIYPVPHPMSATAEPEGMRATAMVCGLSN